MEKPRFLASNWCSAMPHRRGSWIPRCAPRQYPWVSIAEEKQTMLLRKSWSLNFSAVARLALPRNRYQNSIPKTLIDKNRTLAWNERRGSGYQWQINDRKYRMSSSFNEFIAKFKGCCHNFAQKLSSWAEATGLLSQILVPFFSSEFMWRSSLLELDLNIRPYVFNRRWYYWYRVPHLDRW